MYLTISHYLGLNVKQNVLLHNLAVIITHSTNIQRIHKKLDQDNRFSLLLTNIHKRRKKKVLLCNHKHLLCLCQQATPDWISSHCSIKYSDCWCGAFNTSPIGNIQRLLKKKHFYSLKLKWAHGGTDGRSEIKSENSDSLLQCSNTALTWSIGANKYNDLTYLEGKCSQGESWHGKSVTMSGICLLCTIK